MTIVLRKLREYQCDDFARGLVYLFAGSQSGLSLDIASMQIPTYLVVMWWHS